MSLTDTEDVAELLAQIGDVLDALADAPIEPTDSTDAVNREALLAELERHLGALDDL